MNLKQLSEKYEEYVIQMRREFHKYPEVSFKEIRTAQRIREELQKIGIPFVSIEPNIVIATIKGKKEGKTIAIRGDIDALPMQEDSDIEYKSEYDGIMHSCGHDAHGAMLLGLAHMLNDIKEGLEGKVLLVFQAAEEVGGGHNEIIQYFKENGGPDRLIATHVWSNIEAGKISVEPGPRMAGGSGWRIDITGRGGHGSRPDQSIDPIKPACDIVLKISSIPVNHVSVLEQCVVHACAIHGGTTIGNIIPNSAEIIGGYRYFTEESSKKVFDTIKQMSEGIGQVYGVDVKVTHTGGIGPVINNEESVKMAKEVVSNIDGLELDSYEPICASDCYGEILKEYPGFYCYLGVGNKEKGIIYAQHHPKYNIDEDTLKLGCEFMAKYAVEFLNKNDN
ncbi:M20 metallopeptidase family protein [Clostridioides difficile]|uniref:M20 metallopeptidase family protein n=1 Tax=Clostridioides difficile TaxID=1496 RepID=UPI000989AD04|nr:amidohydrolase [Clostridioides difficile]MCV2271676.1 amidohydrolase [Clostridioides difficile]MDV9712470.1 amidohydrolase [Clostridioides difficile]HBF5909662.1 amidohydrolase [Clostridioides difficile]HBF6292186.1 amidohydrolase [Clostridioides difficile]HBG8469399.1 amidohydrolase [Clostridioides difficile]